MRPSLPGLVSVHDLKTLFSNSTAWVTIHQDPESIDEPEFVDKGPFVQISLELLPAEPVQTEFETDHDTGLIKRIKVRRREPGLIVPGR